jgi:predicted branched-subunit amino acid permease
LFRDVALVCLADGLVGVSFGATTVAGHLPWWLPVAMSLLVFAGGSQFAAVGVVLAGGSPVAAVAAGAVLNTRLLPYGFAVADVVGPPERADPGGTARPGVELDRTDPDRTDLDRADLDRSDPDRADPDRTGPDRAAPDRADPDRTRPVRWGWLIRLLGAQVITDESTAFTLRQTEPARRRAAFWTCGLSLFAVWNVSVLLGVLAGSVVRNTSAFGLDATFPAVVIALALPALADLRTRFSAGTGAVIAVALTPVLPAGLPVLVALAGLATGWRPRRRTTAHLALAQATTHPSSDQATTDPSSDHRTAAPTTSRATSTPTTAHPTVVETTNSANDPTAPRRASGRTVAHSPSDRGEL